MLSPSALLVIDDYWRGHFGCAEGATLYTAPPRVVPHAGELAGYAGVFALYRATGGSVISLPQFRISRGCALLPAAGVPLEEFADLFPVELCERVVGPAWIGYTLTDPPCHGDGRLLNDGDEQQMAELRAACDGTEWDHGGSTPGECPGAAGVFRGGTLVALAGYEVWGARLAHISVITHPGHRGNGYGSQAVARLASHVLGLGLIPQYRTLESNVASMAIARALGFEHYASTVAVRLRTTP